MKVQDAIILLSPFSHGTDNSDLTDNERLAVKVLIEEVQRLKTENLNYHLQSFIDSDKQGD